MSHLRDNFWNLPANMSLPPKSQIKTPAELVEQIRRREQLRRLAKAPAPSGQMPLSLDAAPTPPSPVAVPPPPVVAPMPRRGDLLVGLEPPPSRAELALPPLWTPGVQRLAPVCLLRSAVFGVMPRGQRRQFQNHPIAALPGFTLTFTGTQLDQFDLDVWLQAVDIAKQNGGLGVKAEFTAYGFLQAIGRSPKGKDHHERLHDSLTRMVACALRVSTERFDYVGNLLDFYRDRALARYALTLNPKLIQLFADGSTPIDWELRRQLRKDVSRWLHGYLASQGVGKHRLSAPALQQLCGSTSQLKEWRRTLKGALDELQGVGGIKSWRIEKGDELAIELSPSSSTLAIRR